ncbi:MAG: sugar transferase [Chloroflexota bacterium]
MATSRKPDPDHRVENQRHSPRAAKKRVDQHRNSVAQPTHKVSHLGQYVDQDQSVASGRELPSVHRWRTGMKALVGHHSWRTQRSKMRMKRWIEPLLLGSVDALLIVLGCALAYTMRYQVNWPFPFQWIISEVVTEFQVDPWRFVPYAIALLALLIGLFVVKGLYRLPRNAGALDHAGIIVSSTTIGVAILIVAVFLHQAAVFYSRLIFAFAWLWIIILLCSWRGLLIEYRRWRWTQGIGREQVLVVGGTGLGREIMESIVAQPFLGYKLVGYLDDRPPPTQERRDGHFQHLGNVQELPILTRLLSIDQVILALPFWEHRRLPDLVAACREAGVEFRVAPDLYELSFDRADVRSLGSVPLIGLKEVSLKGWKIVVKRIVDLALIVIASPLLLLVTALIALAIKYDSKGPVIFRQKRVGKNQQLFTAYKFRTMTVDAEERKSELSELNEADGPMFKMRNDPRITRTGRFLRRTSMDELPQLWNVLRGEMSLVGPRPPTLDEVAQYEEWHKRRLEVVPGLTGLWQVLGRSDTSFDEMVRLDVYYTENWSPAMDVRILLQTIPVVLSGKGAY